MKRWIVICLMLSTLSCAGSQGITQGTQSMEQPSKAAADYQATCDTDLLKARDALRELEGFDQQPTVDTFLDDLNNLLIHIDRGMNRAGLYSVVHPDTRVRDSADKCEQEFRKIVTSIGLSQSLYRHAKAIDAQQENPATKRYLKHLLRDFRRGGVDKDEAVQKQIRALKEELTKIGQEFGKNIREDVRHITLDSVADLEGLPDDYIKDHPANSQGNITITTDYPDYIAFMKYAKSNTHRLALYQKFRQRGYPKNLSVLTQLLQKRYALAQALGYKNWAAFITEDKMIKTQTAVRDFIDKIKTISLPRAQLDYAELRTRLQADNPQAKRVGDWEKSYLGELVKKEKYDFDSQAVRSYFTYEKTRDGIFNITTKMFGVTFKRLDQTSWHNDVEAYEIVEQGHVIGQFFLDMHPRDNKYKHAAAFPLVTGVANKQTPVAALVCNFPKSGPIEHSQVETFFHEFGHLLHYLFAGQHRWIEKSGFNTEWDFVEVPSQMFEEWAWDASTLKSFATNAKGEPIPDTLITAMGRARDFGKGIWVSQQMLYAAVSLNYYDQDPTHLDTTEEIKQLQAKYALFDYVDDTYFQLSFGHLDGYSAIYYTYMWSLVIAKDLFDVFKQQGMLNPKTAARYRKLILAPGGSKDAEQMVREFLGRDYSFDAFSRWLRH